VGQQHAPPPARRRCARVANDIVVVSGPLPVDELNKCLWVSGYVRRMFKRLATLPHGKLQRPAEPFRKAA
jgi:hypothetical protein